MIDARQDDLHRKLQLVLAGEKTGDCLAAQVTSLAATIAFASDDIAEADRIADATLRDLKSDIRLNWDYVRQVRAAAASSKGGHA